MPLTRSGRKTKAQSPKVYSPKSKHHQMRFPPRKSFSIPSTKMLIPHSTPTQSTLTQIDFAHTVPDSDGEDEWAGRVKKRRKIGRDDGNIKRQSTLTQIGFVQPELYSDEEFLAENEGMVLGQEITDSENEVDFETDDKLNYKVQKKEEEVESQQICFTNSVGAHKHNFHETSSHGNVSQNSDTAKALIKNVFKTPQKPIKREIPSSQSPAESLLTPYNFSPSRPQRTPLQEIPANVIAMRDISPHFIIKEEPMAEANQNFEVDSTDENDQENYDPAAYRNAEVYPSTEQHNYLDGSHCMAPPILGQCEKLKQPDFNPIGTLTKERDNNTRSPHQKSRSAHSSQATTVDLTQSSPLGHSTRLTSMSRLNDEEQQSFVQFPILDGDSQFPIFSDDLGYYSPLSSVQNSQDIITVSQLLPSSMVND